MRKKNVRREKKLSAASTVANVQTRETRIRPCRRRCYKTVFFVTDEETK